MNLPLLTEAVIRGHALAEAVINLGLFFGPGLALAVAGWAIVRGCTWVWRLLAAADQWIRDTQADSTGSSIDDTELADWLALGTAELREEEQ